MAIILTWNPARWQFPSGEYDSFVATGEDLAELDQPHDRWSVGQRRHGIDPGERAFLLRQGHSHRGLVAAGWVMSDIYLAPHWDRDRKEEIPYVDVKWSRFLSTDNEIPIEQLLAEVPDVKWNNIYSSASTSLAREIYVDLERLWTSAAGDWALQPGQHLSRDERMRLYGGAKYGGIEPSARTPNLFIYSDPVAGHRSGYIFDGWSPDGSVYLYTGEGQVGDQQLTDGNKALLEHRTQGRTLRLFVADGTERFSTTKKQLYVGAFEVDNDSPIVREDAPDRDGQQRQVVVFRLRPLSLEHVRVRSEDHSLTGDAQRMPEATLIDPEAANQEHHSVRAKPESIATRNESLLSREYEEYLALQGTNVKRWRLRPPGGLNYLFTDLYDEDHHELYEAKASAKREDIRQAVGQLLDYRRLMPRPDQLLMSVLLPTRPSEDMLNYLHSVRIGCVHKDASLGEFVRVRV